MSTVLPLVFVLLSYYLLLGGITPSRNVFTFKTLVHSNTRLAEPRVFVVTVWTNFADILMPRQVHCLLRYLQHELIYVVIDNAKLHNESANIRAVYSNLPARAQAMYIRLPTKSNYWTSPSHNHGFALNTAFQVLANSTVIQQTDIVWLLDADMFLFSPLSFSKVPWNILTVLQKRTTVNTTNSFVIKIYIWPNFAVFKLNNISLLAELDFFPGFADSGSKTYDFLQRHTNVALHGTTGDQEKPLQATQICHANASQNRVYCPFVLRQFEGARNRPAGCVLPEIFLLDVSAHSLVYHLRSAGSNWRGCSNTYMSERSNDLAKFIDSL